MEKIELIRKLRQLWQEYLEAYSDNKEGTEPDLNNFMNYLNNRYGNY